jgi:GT2 family glycosyltransferase
MTHDALRDDVGAVGAVLLYPDGRVQHAGVVLGAAGVAAHVLRFWDASNPDPMGRLTAKREVAAVTGACLTVRADRFDEVGGFAEDLPVTLNDIDFCLRLAARGYRNLVTPAARLIHHESVSRGLDADADRLARLDRETAAFERRWRTLNGHDPWFSPHLMLTEAGEEPRRL